MKPALVALLSLGSLLSTAAVSQAAPVRRFALVAGANDGGAGRPTLRYAISDAERFASVITQLGGVAAEDATLLRQPAAGAFDQALSSLRERVSAAREAGGTRTEVLVYYSGHADDQGLLLGADRYSYRSLRDQLDGLAADVRIAVLDACASGAITRLKGGRQRAPFLVDESAEMRGHAFLTSSSETEAAQESDNIGGSYFTHSLVSGLRGAADSSGEGKVTLNEAYQFAFNETLGRTVDSRGGAQHPSYDINLSGTGDVVMTDLRQTTAALVLGESIDGRFFVRNAKRELVVELYKPVGRRVELGLEPGRYEVRVEREAAALVATAEVVEGEPRTLEPVEFSAAKLEPTRRRGPSGPPIHAVAGRSRFELRAGLWSLSQPQADVVAGSSSGDLLTGVRFTRFLREDLAVTVGADVRPGDSGTRVSSSGVVAAGDETVIGVGAGVRWNPFHPEARTIARPCLVASLGPLFRTRNGAFVAPGSVEAGSNLDVGVGGLAGVGLDLSLGHSFALGLDAGYRWTLAMPKTAGFHDSYGGFELSLGIGWLFGKGHVQRR